MDSWSANDELEVRREVDRGGSEYVDEVVQSVRIPSIINSRDKEGQITILFYFSEHFEQFYQDLWPFSLQSKLVVSVCLFLGKLFEEVVILQFQIIP